MFKDGIRIEWLYGTEYIELNPEALLANTAILSTIEVWRDGSGAVQYNVRSRIEKVNQDSFVVFLTYDSASNNQIAKDYPPFIEGTSTIRISVGAGGGDASWVGSQNHDYDGNVKWTKLPSGLTGSIKRQTVSRIQREQQQLRAALLAIDKVCAITSEPFADVLDAAHIIAAKSGGREIVENAILLRSDVHRLLDSGAISIGKDGVVNIRKELPADYQKLLLGKRLALKIHERVSKALEYVANAT